MLQVAGVGTVLGAPGLWVVHLPGVRDPLAIGEEMLDALFRAVTD